MKRLAMVAVIAGCGGPRLPDDTSWVTALPPGVFSYQLAAFEDDVVVFDGPGEGAPYGISRFSGTDGGELWSVPLQAGGGKLVVADGSVVNVRAEMTDVALDRYDGSGAFLGTTRWSGLPTMQGCLYSLVIAASAHTIVVSACGAYQRGRPTDPSPAVQMFATPPAVLAATDDRLAVSQSGVAIVDAAGEHPIASGYAAAMQFAPDGDLVIVEADGVSRFAPTGALRWTAPVGFAMVETPSLAIAPSGTILVGAGVFYGAVSADNHGFVVAIDAAGTITRSDTFYTWVLGLVAPAAPVAMISDPSTILVGMARR